MFQSGNSTAWKSPRSGQRPRGRKRPAVLVHGGVMARLTEYDGRPIARIRGPVVLISGTYRR
jgi:hypothetical protein